MIRNFKRILCPVDFSEYSALALRYAAALAKDNEAALVIYYSLPDLRVSMSYLEGNYMTTVDEVVRSRAQEKMDAFVEDLIPADLPVEKRIGTGSPSAEIAGLAKKLEADLIVMGTHGHSGYERFFIGSITNKVLHKSTVPVLVVCKPTNNFIRQNGPRPIQIKRILCALDFENTSQRIAKVALSIARTYQSQVCFFHAVRDPVDMEKEQLLVQNRMKELVDPVQEDWYEVQFLAGQGDPSEQILKTVAEQETDLLVMGHHTRKPIEELFLGSVAKHVVTESKCPVLVVRSDADYTYKELDGENL